MSTMDIYVICDIFEYVDVDTRLIIQRINKQFDEQFKSFIPLTDGARICSTKMVYYDMQNCVRFYECGSHWNDGLYNACVGGDLDIINLIISKGANDWNTGLAGACNGGNLDIVNLMILKGATNWDNGLQGACDSGHLELVKLMISKGSTNWRGGLCWSCWSSSDCHSCKLPGKICCGHMDIVNLMIEKGSTDLNEGLSFACHERRLGMVKFMIEKGTTKCWCNKSMAEHLHEIDLLA